MTTPRDRSLEERIADFERGESDVDINQLVIDFEASEQERVSLEDIRARTNVPGSPISGLPEGTPQVGSPPPRFTRTPLADIGGQFRGLQSQLDFLPGLANELQNTLLPGLNNDDERALPPIDTSGVSPFIRSIGERQGQRPLQNQLASGALFDIAGPAFLGISGGVSAARTRPVQKAVPQAGRLIDDLLQPIGRAAGGVLRRTGNVAGEALRVSGTTASDTTGFIPDTQVGQALGKSIDNTQMAVADASAQVAEQMTTPNISRMPFVIDEVPISGEDVLATLESGDRLAIIQGPAQRFNVFDPVSGQPLVQISARRLEGNEFEVAIRGLDLQGNPLPFDQSSANIFNQNEILRISGQIMDRLGADALSGIRLPTGREQRITQAMANRSVAAIQDIVIPARLRSVDELIEAGGGTQIDVEKLPDGVRGDATDVFRPDTPVNRVLREAELSVNRAIRESRTLDRILGKTRAVREGIDEFNSGEIDALDNQFGDVFDADDVSTFGRLEDAIVSAQARDARFIRNAEDRLATVQGLVDEARADAIERGIARVGLTDDSEARAAADAALLGRPRRGPFPQISRIAERMREDVQLIDARPDVTDLTYKEILSTGSRDVLKPGETWRSRVLAMADAREALDIRNGQTIDDPVAVAARDRMESMTRLTRVLRSKIASTEEAVTNARASANDAGVPDDPIALAQRVLEPEGVPLLSNVPNFDEQIGVAAVRSNIGRLGQALATPVNRQSGLNARQTTMQAAQLLVRNGVVRKSMEWVPGLYNPQLFAQRQSHKAGIVRSSLIDDGRQKIVGLMAHARKVGTQDDLFGRTDPATGRLLQDVREQTGLRGKSVNEIAENPSRFNLTTKQREWLDVMNKLETEVFNFANRQGVPISKLNLERADVERYAGRIHIARVTADGTIIERGTIGGPGSLGGQAPSQRRRTFKTMEEAAAAGFQTMSYEQSFQTRAQSVYNRVVNQKTSDWMLKNLDPDVNFDAAEAAIRQTLGSDAPRVLPSRFSQQGVATRQLLDDLEGMFPDAPPKLLEGINSLNAVQRIFALAGDDSLATIQFIVMAFRHPVVFAGTQREFVQTLVQAAISPQAARTRRARFLVDNAQLIQNSPGLILSDSGLEFTEALGKSGWLGPNGIYQGSNGVMRQAGMLPGRIAAVLRPFQQAFESAMDQAGVSLMKGLEDTAKESPENMRSVVDYVNNMRGLTSSARLGLDPTHRMFESMILLAPRYRRSTAATYINAFQGGTRGRLARRALLHLAGGAVLTHVGLSIGLGQAQGKSWEQITDEITLALNPANKEFMLWKVGGTSFGLGSKFVSDLRMLGRLATSTGDFGDFTEVHQNPGVRWARSQMASVPSTAIDWLVGANYMGEPISKDITGDFPSFMKSVGKTLGEEATFLWLQAIMFEGGTRHERAGRGGADFFGMRAYPSPGPSLNDVSNAMYIDENGNPMDFSDLGPRNERFWTKPQRAVNEARKTIMTKEQRRRSQERSERGRTAREPFNELLPAPGYQQRINELNRRFNGPSGSQPLPEESGSGVPSRAPIGGLDFTR